jgi:hypothetical protein
MIRLVHKTSTFNVYHQRRKWEENHAVRERGYVVELISLKQGRVFPFFQALSQRQAIINSDIQRMLL